MPMRARSWAVTAGLCLGLAGCGGSDTPTRPATPAAPTPTPVPAASARDGMSEQAVAAEITPAQPGLRTAVTARAPGYLTREALYEGTPLFLWPSEESYVRQIVYGDEPPYDRLLRWDTPIRVTADAELLGNGAVMSKLEEVVAEGRRTTGWDIAIVQTGGNVQVQIDPDQEDSVAYAETRYRGPTIVSARMVFWKLPEITGGHGSQYRNTLLHEFGHVLGLAHSPEDNDVMIEGQGRGAKVGAYSEHETVVLRMMYRHRRAGNLFPDRAPELSAQSTAEYRRIVRD
jgi:hypothetical protein